jgi:hypothetical protein
VQPPDSASQHPVDRLIVRLIRAEVNPSPDALRQIVDRMATAPFNRRLVRVPSRDRGMAYGDVILGRTIDSLEYHLVKRIRGERQWADGTTVEEYQLDLRDATQHPSARILVYERSGEAFAATISPTIDVVPSHRLGRNWLHHLFVVYSARRGNLKTAYMFSDLSELDVPETIRWLK